MHSPLYIVGGLFLASVLGVAIMVLIRIRPWTSKSEPRRVNSSDREDRILWQRGKGARVSELASPDGLTPRQFLQRLSGFALIGFSSWTASRGSRALGITELASRVSSKGIKITGRNKAGAKLQFAGPHNDQGVHTDQWYEGSDHGDGYSHDDDGSQPWNPVTQTGNPDHNDNPWGYHYDDGGHLDDHDDSMTYYC